MAILLCNDDGISAEGLVALRTALADVDDLWVVAPDRDQSAVSHSLTLQRPLRIDEVGPQSFSVDGTPTDCIILAMHRIFRDRDRPRLVVSGINRGANLGDDITYSGTVSAAMEATLLGVPAIAVSLAARDEFDYGPAAALTRRLVDAVLANPLPADTLLNVNVPPGALDVLKGYAMTRQGKRRYSDAIVEKVDPRGRKYYWIGGEIRDVEAAEGTDFHAVQNGFVSVTPLHLDLTNYTSLREIEYLQLEWPGGPAGSAAA